MKLGESPTPGLFAAFTCPTPHNTPPKKANFEILGNLVWPDRPPPQYSVTPSHRVTYNKRQLRRLLIAQDLTCISDFIYLESVFF